MRRRRRDVSEMGWEEQAGDDARGPKRGSASPKLRRGVEPTGLSDAAKELESGGRGLLRSFTNR